MEKCKCEIREAKLEGKLEMLDEVESLIIDYGEMDGTREIIDVSDLLAELEHLKEKTHDKEKNK